MKLNDLKPAWQQRKLSHALSEIDAHEILSIIDSPPVAKKAQLPRLLFNLLLFIAITLVCQGG